MTLPALLECFTINQQLKNNSPKTIDGYVKFIGQFFGFLDVNYVDNPVSADTLTIQHVNAYQLYLKAKPKRNGNGNLSPKTIQTYMRHVKVFLRFCFNEELIHKDIAQKMVTPKAGKPVIEILTDNEAKTLLGAFDTKTLLGMRNHCICLLMLDCGLRVAEVCGLRIGDVNLDVGYVRVTGKGDKGRVVPIGLKCRQVLLRYIYRHRFRAHCTSGTSSGEDCFLFVSRTGNQLTVKAVVQLFRKLKKRLAMPRIHAHLLRHTFATNFLLAGLGDVYQLACLLGHGAVSTTEIYLHAANYYRLISGGKVRTYWDSRA
jgi:integrase/recombinase XerC/integrase/recombinase XerD